MANNLYTTDIVTTTPTISNSGGLLSSSSVFPPSNVYKMIFTPKPGEQIQAAHFRNVSYQNDPDFDLSLFGSTNSHTQWPSRFQLTVPGLGSVDTTTTSGYREFNGIYKVVFEDSTNPTNDVNWELYLNPQNIVYMWIYFGKNETTAVEGDLDIMLDIDYHPDPFTLAETTTTGPTPAPIITNFNI